MMAWMCRVEWGEHMSAITNHLILDLIKHNYRPFDKHEEFRRGFSACQAGNCHNPYKADSISAQAWDHGVEAAMRYAKESDRRLKRLLVKSRG